VVFGRVVTGGSIGRSSQLSFHRVTAGNRTASASAAGIFDDGLDERGGGHEADAAGVHFRHEALAGGVDKIDIAKVEDSGSAAGGGGGSLPALAEFFDPGAREAAFEVKAEFGGAVVNGDLEHARYGEGKTGARAAGIGNEGDRRCGG